MNRDRRHRVLHPGYIAQRTTQARRSMENAAPPAAKRRAGARPSPTTRCTRGSYKRMSGSWCIQVLDTCSSARAAPATDCVPNGQRRRPQLACRSWRRGAFMPLWLAQQHGTTEAAGTTTIPRPDQPRYGCRSSSPHGRTGVVHGPTCHLSPFDRHTGSGAAPRSQPPVRTNHRRRGAGTMRRGERRSAHAPACSPLLPAALHRGGERRPEARATSRRTKGLAHSTPARRPPTTSTRRGRGPEPGGQRRG
jgi:hypothetical protein